MNRFQQVANILPTLLTLIVALAFGCGNTSAEKTSDDCGCYTSEGVAYGTAEGQAALKQWLLESVAQFPEADERYQAYNRALERFDELNAFYEDDILTPDERWVKVSDKLAVLMWPNETTDASESTTTRQTPQN